MEWRERENSDGVELKENHMNSVLEVRRACNRVICLRMDTACPNECYLCICYKLYAPQVGCEWEKMSESYEEGEVLHGIPREERWLLEQVLMSMSEKEMW